MPAKLDLTGHKFHRLTVLREAPRSAKNKTKWLCVCECGNEIAVHTMHLRAGHTKSCGCIPRQNSDRVLDPESGEMVRPDGYYSWTAIRSRCYCTSDLSYPDYGGRGIVMCERWRGPGGLANFLSDMGAKPARDYSVGRIDPNGNYSPENCRWENDIQQAVSKRGVRLVEHNGKKQSIMAWERELGLSVGGIHWRIRRGWTKDQAFSVPRQGGEKRSRDNATTASVENQRGLFAPEWELTG
jgi:hypothetical protein